MTDEFVLPNVVQYHHPVFYPNFFFVKSSMTGSNLLTTLPLSPSNYIIDIVPCAKNPHIVAAPCTDNHVYLIDASTRQSVARSSVSKDTRPNVLTDVCPFPNNPNLWLLSMKDERGTVQIWDVRSPQMAAQVNGSVSLLACIENTKM